ncbi:MAG: type II toxin-antitoxin system RelB/DinJ family antitoxin [Desulfovibrionaceae bacterium]|nr:type II toxin-antitoxin system RelB/DinJ family antitoxin [Desulfovibrionaceae bacterium]
MPSTSMTIRTDAQIKQQAQQIFSDLGMDMTTAVNIFLRQAIRHNGLPFDVRLERLNAASQNAIEESLAGKNLSKPFDSVDELMESLDA